MTTAVNMLEKAGWRPAFLSVSDHLHNVRVWACTDGDRITALHFGPDGRPTEAWKRAFLTARGVAARLPAARIAKALSGGLWEHLDDRSRAALLGEAERIVGMIAEAGLAFTLSAALSAEFAGIDRETFAHFVPDVAARLRRDVLAVSGAAHAAGFSPAVRSDGALDLSVWSRAAADGSLLVVAASDDVPPSPVGGWTCRRSACPDPLVGAPCDSRSDRPLALADAIRTAEGLPAPNGGRFGLIDLDDFDLEAAAV